MARGKNQTVKYVLIAILVLGLAYLYFHGHTEGFQSKAEFFKFIPIASANPADKILEIPKSAYDGKTLNDIKLYRWSNNAWVDIPRENYDDIQGLGFNIITRQAVPAQRAPNGRIIRTAVLENTVPLIIKESPQSGTTTAIRMPANSSALGFGIRVKNLDNNNLGIQTNEKDSRGNNLKVELIFA